MDAGYLREEDLPTLIGSADILFGGILLQVLRRPKEADHSREMTRRFFEYLNQMLRPILQKETAVIAGVHSEES